ncbi:MAG: MbnP family protein [Fluviicola sp.]
MKSTIKKSLFFLGLIALTVSSCKKDEEDTHTHDEATNGQVKVQLTHKWGMETSLFQLNTEYTHPMNGELMTFTKYKYYISNFKLKKSDGTWWVHPESYFLVDLSNTSSTLLNLGDLPAGEYTEMSYVLGVDSLRNVSGAQTGALAASNAMFWSWNSGYIMVKAEGTSPASSTGSFAFHLGGFFGANNVVTTKTISFASNPLTITASHSSEVHINVNPAMTWCTNGNYCSQVSTIMMPGTQAKAMANDFYNGFIFDHIVE